MSSWIIVGLVFVAVVLAVEGFFSVFVRGARDRSRINRRLGLTQTSPNRMHVLEQLRRERGLLSGDYSRIVGLRRMVLQSGLRLTTRRVATFFFVSSFLSFLVIGLLVRSAGLAVLASLVLSTLLMFLLLVVIRRLRIARFAEQLPDAIDIMVRSLKAGHPIPVSLALVAEEMPDPAGSEFGIAADELTFGSDLETAIQNLYERVGQEDLLFLVICISIHSATGGNLAEPLEKLSELIRERFKLRRKVRALSAEGRFSARGLSVLPFLLFFIVNMLAPRYYGAVWEHPFTNVILLIVGVLIIVGNIVIYKMVNFRY